MLTDGHGAPGPPGQQRIAATVRCESDPYAERRDVAERGYRPELTVGGEGRSVNLELAGGGQLLPEENAAAIGGDRHPHRGAYRATRHFARRAEPAAGRPQRVLDLVAPAEPGD